MRPRDVLPEAALAFVAGQLHVAPGHLPITPLATKPGEQLSALRAAFVFRMFAPEHKRESLACLLPIALGNTNALTIAAASTDELRAPTSVIERLVAAAATLAERQVADRLTRGLPRRRSKRWDASLTSREDARTGLGASAAWGSRSPRSCTSGGATRCTERDRH